MVIKALLILGILSLGAAIALLGWEEFFFPREEVESHFHEGTRLLQARAWDGASKEFRFALLSPDSTLQFAAHHNLALALLQMALSGEGRKAFLWAEEAIHHGEEALKLRPGSGDSAWNLEMALKRAQELNQDKRDRGGESAERFLASFRLQEEGALSGPLREQLGGGGMGRTGAAMRGPAW